MGLLDKIKNALFEVEYVEVEDIPKHEKKSKKKDIEEEKPIAQRVILASRDEDVHEETVEKNVVQDDRPEFLRNTATEEVVDEPKKEDFKFMDDNDFKVEEDIYASEEPELLEVDDFKEPAESKFSYYDNHKERDSRLYGVDDSYKVPMHEYGTYEKKDEKSYFRPSPIISPIYGILDKNYRKEDVVQKKEVRIPSFSRSSVNVDDVRNKAYGMTPRIERSSQSKPKFEVEEDDEKVLVDLNESTKPEVKELTMGDAVEYYQDLGLEYNVDYVDVSKNKENKEDTVISEDVDVTPEIEPLEEVSQPEEEKHDDLDTDNDNLFDLIDSMYQESN